MSAAVALESCEVVIRVRGNLRCGEPRAEQRLEEALRRLRKERYEVDLYLRGTWRRAGSFRPTVLTETRMDTWRMIGAYLQADSSLAPGRWIACSTRKPWPEIVLRGTRYQ